MHVIGISTLVGAHLPLVPELIQALREAGAQDMVVVCGGVIPEQDHQLLYEAGVAFIATPGTPVHVSATAVLAQLERIAAANMSDDF